MSITIVDQILISCSSLHRDVSVPDGKSYNSAFESYKKSGSPQVQLSSVGNQQNLTPP